MSTRYATIIKDNDGNDLVSNIAQIEGNPSQPGGNARLVKVGDAVKIGMVRGGPVDKADGFGFPEGTPSTGAKAEKAEPKKAEKAED